MTTYLVEYRARPIPAVWQTAGRHVIYEEALDYARWLFFCHPEIKRVRLSDGEKTSFTLVKRRVTLG